jgi:hypothetical protein
LSQQLTCQNFIIFYNLPSGRVPIITQVLYKNQDLSVQIQNLVSSTLIGVVKTQPFYEQVIFHPNFENFCFEIWNDIVALKSHDPSLAISIADFFFQHCCIFYWNLIINVGSKNQACAYLEKMCELVTKWEKSTKKRIHKGTPFYFLTFVYRELGDIDSAFASAFRAINEDKKSLDPLFGLGSYKNSPAYKYVSLRDDPSNYLYREVLEIRTLIDRYRREYEVNVKHSLPLSDIDVKFLQGKGKLDQIGHFFVYTLEEMNKYLKQSPVLPDNDFYRFKNIREIFNFCLITDKILEYRYKRRFLNYNPNNEMYISDGIMLYFDDKRYIPRLNSSEKRSLRRHIQTNPPLPKTPKELVNNLFLNPVLYTFKRQNLRPEMRYLLFAHHLRNIGAHDLQKDNIFVSNYELITKWLIFSIFAAIEALT